MRRLYEPAAYAPPARCYWTDTFTPAPWDRMEGSLCVDVAIIGGGVTGLNAALALAGQGVSVVVLEAGRPGFGASGRNGGFCCPGGAMLGGRALERRFGPGAGAAWQALERRAIAFVADLIARHGMQVDRCAQGETVLAHSPRAWRRMQREARGADVLHEAKDLRARGMGGPWLGGKTAPFGFALNPLKYLDGLAGAARGAGARLVSHCAVTGLERAGQGWRLAVQTGSVQAENVLIASNGYSSEDLPDWMRARFLPVQSSVIVTRVLREAEQAAAGWTSAQMAYDSRALLHYFRLLPEGRFLFGMRGGLNARPRTRARIARAIRADFHRLFPAWRGVEITHDWDGLVCLMPRLTPFIGPVPDRPGLFAALGYHGNGVAMGSLAGALIARSILGKDPDMPGFLAQPQPRWPLGRFRRALLAPSYAAALMLDL